MEKRRGVAKFGILAVLVLLIGTLLCGCIPKPVRIETSKKYLVGYDFSSYADVYGMAPVITCAVRYDKSVDATFSWRNKNDGFDSKTLNFKLTDDQFYNIESQVKPLEIFKLNPKCSDPNDVMDGGSSYLFVYGPDDEVLKECGGFCPTNKRFHEIRRILFDNIPEELREVYSQYEDLYMTQYKYDADPEYENKMNALFEETYGQYIEK